MRKSDGSLLHLSDLEGKLVLIVNVASRCGFTPQYKGLQALYEKYASQGFMVLAFPCNQFGYQEPGAEAEIQSFCQLDYGVTFPVLGKVNVNGPEADPLWVWLKSEKPGLFGTREIKWNFTKFLVDAKGKVLSRFAPQTTPQQIESEIENYLKSIQRFKN